MDLSLADAKLSPLGLAVAAALVVLSIWSLAVAIERWVVFLRARRQSLAFAGVAATYLPQGRPKEVIAAARKYPASHLARVVAAGLQAYQAKSAAGTLGGPALVEAASRAVERSSLLATADLRRGLGTLATIATTAPFIGLFGTVVGIMHAFRGIAESGSAGFAAISQGIAEALATTALGLFVAIPAAWAFNVYTHRIERLTIEMANSASELTDFFLESEGLGEEGTEA